MLIVFDSKSSLTHYTFVKFLSQLHKCTYFYYIALLNILFLKIYVQKLTCCSWKLGFRGIIFSARKLQECRILHHLPQTPCRKATSARWGRVVTLHQTFKQIWVHFILGFKVSSTLGFLSFPLAWFFADIDVIVPRPFAIQIDTWRKNVARIFRRNLGILEILQICLFFRRFLKPNVFIYYVCWHVGDDSVVSPIIHGSFQVIKLYVWDGFNFVCKIWKTVLLPVHNFFKAIVNGFRVVVCP